MAPLIERVVAASRAALQWWLGELAAIIPERFRRGLTPGADRLVLIGDGEALELRLETAKSVERLAALTNGDDAETKRRLQATLRRRGLDRAVGGGRLETCLRLAPTQGSRTVIDLPLIAQSNLAEVVSYELDRHTPFKPEQAHYSYRVIARDPAAKRLSVELTVVPRRVVADAVAAVAELGLDLDRVELAAEDGGAPSGNLLPATTPAARRRVVTVNYLLGAAAATLALVAVYLPIIDAENRAAALARDFGAVKQAAERAATLRKEIDGQRKATRFVLDRKRTTPSVSDLLAEITLILPDDTYLSEWQLHGTMLELTGVTASSSALVGLLEQSRRFRGTSFRSPVTSDKATGRERFHIAVEVVPEGGT